MGYRTVALAAYLIFGAATAIAAAVADPSGEWVGTYTCAQGLTALDLTVVEVAPGQLLAEFHFTADASNPLVPEGCFTMAGRFDANDGHVVLEPDGWQLRPPGYVMVGVDGQLDAAKQTLSGIVRACPQFCV